MVAGFIHPPGTCRKDPMTQRTVTTPEAHQTAKQMHDLIQGELQGTVTKLTHQGQVLSDPNNWDGGLAKQFKGDVWPSVQTALKTMLKELDTLQLAIKTVNENIAKAGN